MILKKHGQHGEFSPTQFLKLGGLKGQTWQDMATKKRACHMSKHAALAILKWGFNITSGNQTWLAGKWTIEIGDVPS